MKFFWFRKFLVLALCLSSMTVVFGCSSEEHKSDLGEVPVPSGTYDEVLGHWTQFEEGYQGGRESFAATVTFLAPEVTEFQAYKDAKALHLSTDQYKAARDKALYDGESKATFFVSLYTHDANENNLDRSGSIWNIFLEVAGRKLTPANVKKVYENSATLKEKYPYITVWANNYDVEFALPAREAAQNNPELTISSVLGSASMKFPK